MRKTLSRPPTISSCGFDGSGLGAADQVLSLVEEPLDWVEVPVAEGARSAGPPYIATRGLTGMATCRLRRVRRDQSGHGCSAEN
jgi:hypothetical protein